MLIDKSNNYAFACLIRRQHGNLRLHHSAKGAIILGLPQRDQSDAERKPSKACEKIMKCHAGCGACCIAPSISSLGKPAGERCKHLTAENLCSIFGKSERPKVCSDFKACDWICGKGSAQAIAILTELEVATV